MRTRHWAAILFACELVVAFLHGHPEASDNAEQARPAQEMLTRLWSAARERADAMRTHRRQTEGLGATYVPSNTEMFGSLLDYAKDKISNPPLLAVERNLMTLHRNTLALATETAALRALVTALVDLESRPTPSAQLEAVLQSRLLPVQGDRYTIIRQAAPAAGDL